MTLCLFRESWVRTLFVVTRVLLLIFYFTLSLHFTPGLQSAVCILPPVCSLQSAVCSLQTAFYTDRLKIRPRIFGGEINWIEQRTSKPANNAMNCLDIKRYTSISSLPNLNNRKIVIFVIGCRNCKSRKPTYKFLTGTHMSLESNVDRLTSSRLLRCVKMLKFCLFMFGCK